MSKRPTRMEQLGSLMTAMIAVIISGGADSLLDSNTPMANVERLAGCYFILPDDVKQKFRSGQPYFGQLAQIARKLDVSSGVLSNVFRGKAKSKRIGTAILSRICELEGSAFLDQVQTVHMPYPAPFSAEERKQFRPHGTYYGIISRVARDLNVSLDAVGFAVRGESSSARIVDQLRSEMAYIDKNPPLPTKTKPFSEDTRAQFNRGGRYFRLYGKVARSLGVTPASVSAVAKGTYRSQRIVAALHVEMNRVDAELASKNGGR